MSSELLYAMSISASLSFDRLNDLFRIVCKPSPAQGRGVQWPGINMRQQVISSFVALGFFEVDYSHRQLHMCPPVLVLLPSPGTPCALFTGGRVPETVRSLREAVRKTAGHARLVQQPQSIGWINMPDRIIVEAVDKETLSTISQEAGIDCDLDEPAAWKLINLSLSITEMSGNVAFEPRQAPSWTCRIFRDDQLKFSSVGKQPDHSLWLAEYVNPIDKQRRHWLWRAADAAKVERNWGRYIVLAEQGRNVLLYEGRSRALVVPATTPLPGLIARAAALSAGAHPAVGTTRRPLASIPAGHPMFLYQDVPYAIVEMIATKLKQKLVWIDMEDIVLKGNDYE